MGYDPNQPQYGQQPQSSYDGQPPSQYMPPPYGQPPQGQPPYGPPPYGQSYVQPQYGAAPMPNYAPQQPKKSLRWLWITLSILGGLLVLGCAGCGAYFFTVGRTAVSVVGPAFSVGEYYQYVKMQDYSKAYSLVSSNARLSVNNQSVPADQQSYTTTAQALDTALSPVKDFSVHPTNSNDTSHLTVTVTRGSRTYDVHLTLAQENGTWKIVSMDGI